MMGWAFTLFGLLLILFGVAIAAALIVVPVLIVIAACIEGALRWLGAHPEQR
jgi:hypothetical protein